MPSARTSCGTRSNARCGGSSHRPRRLPKAHGESPRCSTARGPRRSPMWYDLQGMSFKGRTVVITGGASGIGFAAAERFAAAGADVAILDRNQGELAAAAARLNVNGTRAIALAADVARSADVDAAMARIVADRGRLDVLVNNAGIAFARRIDEYTEEELDRMLAVNLKGAMLCVRAALPALRQTRGAIVSVASMTGLVGQDCGAVYSASKGGLVAMTKSLAIDDIPPGRYGLGGRDIDVIEPVGPGQRIALRDIPAGAFLVQYGCPFAISRGIRSGHRADPDRIEAAIPKVDPASIDLPEVGRSETLSGDETLPASFAGYRRSDGGVGTRNYVLVIPT